MITLPPSNCSWPGELLILKIFMFMKYAKISLCLLLCMFGSQILIAQFLERQLLSSSGSLFENEQIIVSSTQGEVVINSGESNMLILTQGFQQPNIEDLTGTILLKKKAIEIAIFPNPTFDQVSLKFFTDEFFLLEYRLFDISGKQVGQNVFFNLKNQNTQIIDLSEYANGQYYLVLLDEEKQVIKSLGIQKL